MPIQSRAYTFDELIAEFRDTMASEGRVACPVTEFLETKRGVWTIDDAERWLSTDPQYGPAICADIIRTAGTHNAPDVTAEVQRLYGGYLVNFPWDAARYWVEKLLHADIPHGLDAEALSLLLAYVAGNHPNPKALLCKTDVITRLPTHTEITNIPAPDFPELERAEVRGLGRPHPRGAAKPFGSE